MFKWILIAKDKTIECFQTILDNDFEEKEKQKVNLLCALDLVIWKYSTSLCD